MIHDVLFGKPLISLVTVGFAGIVVWFLLSRQRPTTRLVVQILFFGMMTLIIVGSGIEPHRFQGYQSEDPQALLVVLAKSLWWVHLAWAVIG
ncbi:cyclic nucleotide-regulated small mechanosensitive ion channel, partial [Rhizobium sp. Pop5]